MKATKQNQTVVIESSRYHATYTQVGGGKYGKPAHWHRVSRYRGGTAESPNGNGVVTTRRLNEQIASALKLGHSVTIDGVGVIE